VTFSGSSVTVVGWYVVMKQSKLLNYSLFLWYSKGRTWRRQVHVGCLGSVTLSLTRSGSSVTVVGWFIVTKQSKLLDYSLFLW